MASLVCPFEMSCLMCSIVTAYILVSAGEGSDFGCKKRSSERFICCEKAFFRGAFVEDVINLCMFAADLKKEQPLYAKESGNS